MKQEQIIQLIRDEVAKINAERSISALHTSNHTHNGVDSPLLNNAPQTALTASTGLLANAVVRIGEIEVALQKLNLLK